LLGFGRIALVESLPTNINRQPALDLITLLFLQGWNVTVNKGPLVTALTNC
jgi:hypothetical protein